MSIDDQLNATLEPSSTLNPLALIEQVANQPEQAGRFLADTGSLSFPQWTEMAKALVRRESQSQWAWGLWWHCGNFDHGERTALVQNDRWNGPSCETLMNYGSVVKRFLLDAEPQTSLRSEVLPFSYFVALAPLTDEEIRKLVGRCHSGDIRSRSQLKTEIAKLKPQLVSADQASKQRPKSVAKTSRKATGKIIEVETEKPAAQVGTSGYQTGSPAGTEAREKPPQVDRKQLVAKLCEAVPKIAEHDEICEALKQDKELSRAELVGLASFSDRLLRQVLPCLLAGLRASVGDEELPVSINALQPRLDAPRVALENTQATPAASSPGLQPPGTEAAEKDGWQVQKERRKAISNCCEHKIQDKLWCFDELLSDPEECRQILELKDKLLIARATYLHVIEKLPVAEAIKRARGAKATSQS